MKTLKIAIAALFVLAVAALAGIGLPEAADASEDTKQGITVTGTGSVDAKPDLAQLSIGVTTRARTAKDALDANAAKMRGVIAAVKEAGVADKDIQTTDLSSYPSGEKADGFTATNTVSVRVRELERASAILEVATRAGANQVSGPSFSRDDPSALERKALQSAFADARERAEALAQAAGVGLGSVTAINEAGGGGPMPYAEGAMARDSASEAPIESGTQKIQATVTVTFAID